MTTTFSIKPDELNDSFLRKIKSLYGKKEINITVEEKKDETMFLLEHPVNRKKILRSIKNIKEGKNLVEVDINSLKKKFGI